MTKRALMESSEIETAFRDAGAFLADALAKDYEDMASVYAENDCTDAEAAMLLAARHARKMAERLRAESPKALSLVRGGV
jgi:hypothetical protein